MEDLYDVLLRQRIVFVRETLDAAAANLIIAQLLHLAHEDPTRGVTMYINCTEADLGAALSVYDTMQSLQPDVGTLCVGTRGSRRESAPSGESSASGWPIVYFR